MDILIRLFKLTKNERFRSCSGRLSKRYEDFGVDYKPYNYGNTPLNTAIKLKNTAMIDFLIANLNSSLSSNSDGWRDLSFASRYSTVEIVKKLVKSGADVSRSNNFVNNDHISICHAGLNEDKDESGKIISFFQSHGGVFHCPDLFINN